MAKKTFKIQNNLIEALDETVTSANNNSGELHVQVIPIRKIQIDPINPRELQLDIQDLTDGISQKDPLFDLKNQEKSSLSSISTSIANQGVINPVLVYKDHTGYKLISGQRRTLASILAGKTDIPAKILDKKPDLLQITLLQWIENIEREDLSLYDRITNINHIISAYCDKNNQTSVTPSELSKLLGCSLQQAVNYNHILHASETVKELIKNNQIKSIDKAATICKSPPEFQDELIQECLQGSSLRQLKKLAHSDNAELKSLESNTHKKAISLGRTQNINTLKVIIQAISMHPALEHLKAGMPEIDFENQESITAGFKAVIKLLDDNI